jgi:hypothetical protein
MEPEGSLPCSQELSTGPMFIVVTTNQIHQIQLEMEAAIAPDGTDASSLGMPVLKQSSADDIFNYWNGELHKVQGILMTSHNVNNNYPMSIHTNERVSPVVTLHTCIQEVMG